MAYFSNLDEQEIPNDLKEPIINYKKLRDEGSSREASTEFLKILSISFKNHRTWLIHNIQCFVGEVEKLIHSDEKLSQDQVLKKVSDLLCQQADSLKLYLESEAYKRGLLREMKKDEEAYSSTVSNLLNFAMLQGFALGAFGVNAIIFLTRAASLQSFKTALASSARLPFASELENLLAYVIPSRLEATMVNPFNVFTGMAVVSGMTFFYSRRRYCDFNEKNIEQKEEKTKKINQLEMAEPPESEAELELMESLVKALQ